ncbi:MAG: SEC-C domain-containing protein [Pirellulaceae bacterium]|nr:SEC-C domain-containing protein [Pirellulaceae bacterium]
MGAIADAIVAYAQPLLDQCDGDVERMNRAMTIAQVCWNLAISSEEGRDEMLERVKPLVNMTDSEFAEFRQHIVLPMIQRHREMFPGMHGRSKQDANAVGSVPSLTQNYAGTGRNAPCPCGSGLKYKRCCGRR